MTPGDIGDAPVTGVRPFDETARAHILAAHDIQSLRGDPMLARISDFAAALCDAPVALVGLIEEDRHSFLARTGVEQEDSPRETSFCAHAMLEGDIFEISDASRDPRFADNPLVTGAPGIRFYAGAALTSADGIPLGAVCVIDLVPRAGLTPLQRQGLSVLAETVMARLRDNRDAVASRTADDASRRALADSESRFRVLADSMPQMVWSTLPDGYHDYYNARWYEFTGMPPGSTDGEGWNEMFHPDDRERAWELWRHSLTTGAPYQIEYRLRAADGEYRWTLGRALPLYDGNGAITRWFGTCTDIHAQKLASEEREVIAQELSHRIKNIFSVISGLVSLSARGKPELAPLVDDLRDRIGALGRAHDFVRPHSAKSRPHSTQNSLHGLFEELFRPYQTADARRVTITGPDIAIDDRSATPLALLFHELATNATKYGALSHAGGEVAVTIHPDGDGVKLTWKESGGPAVLAVEPSKGFGSQLIELSAVRQLGGSVDREWHNEGLRLTIRIPRAAFSR